jgi:hypothetical protein
MTMSGQAWRFKASSYTDVEDQHLVPLRWGYSLTGLGASAVSPPILHPFVPGFIRRKHSLIFLTGANSVDILRVPNSC